MKRVEGQNPHRKTEITERDRGTLTYATLTPTGDLQVSGLEEALDPAINQLNGDRPSLVRKMFGFEDGTTPTLKEVAEELGISREWARGLYASALRTLKNYPIIINQRDYVTQNGINDGIINYAPDNSQRSGKVITPRETRDEIEAQLIHQETEKAKKQLPQADPIQQEEEFVVVIPSDVLYIDENGATSMPPQIKDGRGGWEYAPILVSNRR